MSLRPIWLIKSKRAGTGRKHIALFIPIAAHAGRQPLDGSPECKGTKIHVVGSPVTGYCHEFQRNYTSSTDQNLESAVRVARLDSKCIVDGPGDAFSIDQEALRKGMLDDMALKVPAPRLTKDYLNPANAVWTMPSRS